MNSWFVLLLFGSIVISSFSKPYQAEYSNDNDAEETEEYDSEQAADDSMSDDQDSRLNDQESLIQDVPRYLQRNTAEDGLQQKTSDKLSASNFNKGLSIRDEPREIASRDDEVRSLPKRLQSDRYNIANTDEQSVQKELPDGNIYKGNRGITQYETQTNQRTAKFDTYNDNEDTFEKSQISRAENDAPDASEQSRYYKQYYNTIQAENRDTADDQSQVSAHYNTRDRRDIKDNNQVEKDMNGNKKSKNDQKSDREDEETAIKRHIQKLTGDELNGLLNALSEDKRELLKKIINDGDTDDNNFINKREITKKAGALEENSLIENSQSDLNKVQGGSPSVELSTESASQKSNSEYNNISGSSTDSNEVFTTKVAGSLNNPEHNEESMQKQSVRSLITDGKSQDEKVTNLEVISKVENKREANFDDLEDADSISVEDSIQKSYSDYQNDQAYLSSQDENLSKFMNSDSGNKACKRETYKDRKSDNINFLEESFPKSYAYDESAQSSVPLVRVKRRNLNNHLQKRSAGLLPYAKVAYAPYRAENEDEDNDEGNEFDDEGFYDRTSNFENSNKALDEDTDSRSDNSAQTKNLDNDSSKAPNENIGTDTVSLGSDTDSVISGVEGVDDNLMYSGNTRNRRIAEDNSSDLSFTNSKSPSLTDNKKKTYSDNDINIPHYQENDSFGPLPRNYDGDLARYKRIRRVKELHNSQELASDG